MEVLIREFQKDDFTELWRLDQECFAPGISYSRQELAHYMTQPGAFTLVAESAESPPPGDSGPATPPRQRKGSPREGLMSILGFVVGRQHRRGLGHIVTIDVRPQARRSGVGTLLMTASEQRLRAGGCGSVYLETAVDNDSALRFYKRHGYYVLKTIPRYYLGKIDALLMGKNLQ